MIRALSAAATLIVLLTGCSGNDSPESRPTGHANPSATKPAEVAAALSRGSVKDNLEEVKAHELRPIEVAGPGTAEQVGAFKLVIQIKKAAPGTRAAAHLEVYPTPLDAVERGRARIAMLERRAKVTGGVRSYCAPTEFKEQKAWECGGTTGLVYVEATVAPRGDAAPYAEPSRNLAIGLMGALIAYAEEKGA